MLEKIFESPLGCKEIKRANAKGNQPWIFSGRTVAEAEAPILWPPPFKEMSHWKRPWFWERLKAGEGDNRGRDGWMASLTQWTWLSKLQEIMKDREACLLRSMGSQKSQTWWSDWTTKQVSAINWCVKYVCRDSKEGSVQFYLSALVPQSCPTLCNPMDCTLPGSSVHGILQARILEWVAIPFFKRSSWPRDQTQVSHIAGRFFTSQATRAQEYWNG